MLCSRLMTAGRRGLASMWSRPQPTPRSIRFIFVESLSSPGGERAWVRGEQRQEARSVELQLLGADARDGEELRPRRRPALRHVQQGGVAEYDVGGHATL